MDESRIKIVHIVSSEGESFEVPISAAKLSEVFSNMINDEDEAQQDIPLSNVNSTILTNVIYFLQHYQLEPMSEIVKPLISSNMGDLVEEWYANFVNEMSQEILFDLVCAAHFLGVEPLVELLSAKIASMIKGKTPAEIRTTFNIRSDFTPEEEAAVREENRWCEEA